MKTESKIALGLAGAAGVGAMVLVARRARASGTDGVALLSAVQVPPTGTYAPVDTTLQNRPLPDPAGLTTDQKAAVVSVFQRQLNDLGYGPLATNGVVDGATNRAANDFLDAQGSRVDPYRAAGLQVANALIESVDDAYREAHDLSRASDYLPAASSGLASRVRSRYHRR